MAEILSINNTKDSNLNAQESDLDERSRLDIVNALVEQGLPRAFSPTNFINHIAENYGISIKDARECLKEAVEQLENSEKKREQETKDGEEKLYAQSGYFYPQSEQKVANEKDNMSSLCAFANFQRLKFGL